MSGGAVDVDLGPRLRAMLEPASSTPPQIVEVGVIAAVNAVLDAIIAGWPVVSGLSISGWRQNGTRIVNEVDYAAYVRNGLYLGLIEHALSDAVARGREAIRKALDASGAGREDFRAKQRARMAALEARRAQLPTPPRTLPATPPVVTPRPSPLAPGALMEVSQELGEAAAYYAARRIGVEPDILSLLKKGWVDTAVRTLVARGRQDQAAQITAAVFRARGRATI